MGKKEQCLPTNKERKKQNGLGAACMNVTESAEYSTQHGVPPDGRLSPPYSPLPLYAW